jgi:hypothetical protein
MAVSRATSRSTRGRRLLRHAPHRARRTRGDARARGRAAVVGERAAAADVGGLRGGAGRAGDELPHAAPRLRQPSGDEGRAARGGGAGAWERRLPHGVEALPAARTGPRPRRCTGHRVRYRCQGGDGEGRRGAAGRMGTSPVTLARLRVRPRSGGSSRWMRGTVRPARRPREGRHCQPGPALALGASTRSHRMSVRDARGRCGQDRLLPESSPCGRGGPGIPSEGRAEAAYARGDQFVKRRRLMGDWAAFLGRAPGRPRSGRRRRRRRPGRARGAGPAAPASPGAPTRYWVRTDEQGTDTTASACTRRSPRTRPEKSSGARRGASGSGAAAGPRAGGRLARSRPVDDATRGRHMGV